MVKMRTAPKSQRSDDKDLRALFQKLAEIEVAGDIVTAGVRDARLYLKRALSGNE